jgi:hypothetical protein
MPPRPIFTAGLTGSLAGVGSRVGSEPERSRVLCRHARHLVASDLDDRGALYAPACFALAAACRWLGVHPSADQWRAALTSVVTLSTRVVTLGPALQHAGLRLGSPAEIFKGLCDEAWIQAGVTDRPTILDQANRQLALGLAINWGLRFLVAYALAVPPARRASEEGFQDLAWLRDLVAPLATA